ncbi:lanthionine synthetase LanC family protein [Taibaiella chishuiensis]|uniref:Lanthionine synthetase-like protein n=1 Tax=Taibaiella chishuiensis TaxID=1434707 RepID=A0A2P8CX82_9BACT|nr:lanthionine synthetase LanC family protein [Taibaiella chishuiensis]PSK89601.1 lanthionine synthetase-like protein [Taibaiella chishuiensis]
MWKALTSQTPEGARNNALLQQIAQDVDQFNYPGNGLYSGNLGKALFYIFYGVYRSDETYVDKGLGVLEYIIQSTSEDEFPQMTFSNGLSGLAHALLMLREADLLELSDEDLGQFDMVLAGAVQYYHREGNFDFLHGLTGCAAYFARRAQAFGPDETSIQVIGETIGYLEGITVKAAIGSYPVTRITFGDIHFQGINFGLAHGMPSFIFLLLQAHRAGIEEERSRHLIYEYIDFMLSRTNSMPGSPSYFPTAIPLRAEDYEGDLSTSRIAWCYGDLGAGMVLLQVATHFKDRALFEKAEEILLFQATRQDPSMDESGLCHGTSGLMHMFNRLFQMTGNNTFKTAAEYWQEETYKLAIHAGNHSGLQTPDWKTKQPQPDGSLLTGVAGTGLTLMAMNSDLMPYWDQLLLIS